MVTQNPKVSGYVPEEVYQRLSEFQSSNQLKSISQALVAILTDYFSISYLNGLGSGNQGLSSRVAELEGELKHVSDRLERMEQVIDSRCPTLADSSLDQNSRNDRQTGQNSRRIYRNPIITPLKPHTATELAERLGVSKSSISIYKSKPDFSEWSRQRDPEGIAWKYSDFTKKFNYLKPESYNTEASETYVAE